MLESPRGAGAGKRVLLLAYMFPPIMDAGGFRPAAFARYLPEFGYAVSVLTRPDSEGLPVDVNQLSRLPPEVRIDRVEKGFREAWHAHYRKRLGWLEPLESVVSKPGAIAEGIAWRVAARHEHRPWEVAWMTPAIEKALTIIERDRPSVLLASAPPFETLKAGWTLHARTGIPFVADYRDPWTYGIHWNPRNQKRLRGEQAWERRVVDQAARILVVTPSMQRTMVGSYPEHAAKVELLMNGYEEFTDTVESTPPLDRFVVRFVGSIMERRLPVVLFEALRRLKSREPGLTRDLRLEFVGPNQTPCSLSDRFQAEGVSEIVSYLGAVGHDRARDLMRSAHVLLHIEPTITWAVSSKLFEYLAAGRPILGILPAGSDDEEFLDQSGAGWNAGTEDPDRVASALHSRWCEWRNGQPSPRADGRWLGQFHRREQTRWLAGILDDVIASCGVSDSGGGRDQTLQV